MRMAARGATQSIREAAALVVVVALLVVGCSAGEVAQVESGPLATPVVAVGPTVGPPATAVPTVVPTEIPQPTALVIPTTGPEIATGFDTTPVPQPTEVLEPTEVQEPAAAVAPTVVPGPTAPPVPQAAPADSQSVLIANGAEVYTLNCARCHAESGLGTARYGGLIGVGSKYSTAGMIAELTTGHPVTFGFADKLSQEEIASVVAYVKAAFP